MSTHLATVQGPFSDAQSRVVRWRDNLVRPGFFLGELHLELNIGPHGPTATSVFFKPIKSLKLKPKNRNNG